MSVLYDDVQRARNIKMSTFLQSLSRYLYEYEWILPLNKPSDLLFILTQQSIMGGHEYSKSDHLSIFTSLKHLMMLLKCKFSGLHVYTLSKTLMSCRAMHAAQIILIKLMETLNNAFKKRVNIVNVSISLFCFSLYGFYGLPLPFFTYPSLGIQL